MSMWSLIDCCGCHVVLIVGSPQPHPQRKVAMLAMVGRSSAGVWPMIPHGCCGLLHWGVCAIAPAVWHKLGPAHNVCTPLAAYSFAEKHAERDIAYILRYTPRHHICVRKRLRDYAEATAGTD